MTLQGCLFRFHRLRLTIACALAVVSVWSLLAAAANMPDRFKLTAENGYLALYVDTDTTEIAIQDQASGTVWYSNPPDRESEEQLARGAAKDLIGSQVVISYFTPDGKMSSMNSLGDSVQYDQAIVSEIPDGVRVVYEFGRRWTDESFLPVMISQDRFEELILKHIPNDRGRQLLLRNYTLLSLEEAGDSRDKLNVYKFDQEKVFGNYNLISVGKKLTRDRDKIALIETLIDQIVEHRHDYASRSDITREDVQQLVDTPTYVLNKKVRPWDKEDMIQLVKSAGYTPEGVQQDHLANHIDPPYPNVITFELPIEYKLDGDSLVVRVSARDIKYPVDVQISPLDRDSDTMTAPIHAVNILPFFGAASTSENGYTFIPDGCGALIDHNNGRLSASPYRQSVYGPDEARMPQTYKSAGVKQIYLPVFGLMKEEQAFLAVIEEGEALAEIVADIAGRTNSYNTVSANFVVMPKGETTLQGDPPILISWQKVVNVLNVYQSRIYEGDIKLRYMFLKNENTDYVAMAHRYRDYLIKRYGMTSIPSRSDIPFFLDLVGGVPVVKPTLGVPREAMEPLTTYSQAASIVDELSHAGLRDLRIRYSGWMDGGMKTALPTTVTFESSLGTEDHFRDLIDEVHDHGFRLYLDVDFLTIGRNTMLDSFSVYRDSSRFLNKRPATVFRYNPATLLAETDSQEYLLSPGRLPGVMDSFLLSYEAYTTRDVSLRDIGWRLYSDFRESPDSLIDRVAAQSIIVRELKGTTLDAYSVMLDGANAYALPYADAIIQLPFSSSGYKLTDRDVPFLQIVLHGLIDYAGEPLNLADDYRLSILNMVEHGGSPHFSWVFRESSSVKGTDFSYLYSVAYRDWIDEALRLYDRLNSTLSVVSHQPIIDHSELSPGVLMTTYSDGTAVVVNYNPDPVHIRGISIDGMDYAVVPKEEGAQ